VGILSWILFGLIAGAVARMAVPGREASGCIATVFVGLVGALIGGFLGGLVVDQDIEFGWHLGPFLFAVGGAVIFLLLLEALAGRRRRNW
jgi:uncharacterized membrane protein YeaQ/YmgE (transglycosylase-associated protein family)